MRKPLLPSQLREISKETVRAICDLEVADEQREFVASNALSIAEAHFVATHWMRAIDADDEPAGFVLTHEDRAEGTFYLWRFMVDRRYQRRRCLFLFHARARISEMA